MNFISLPSSTPYRGVVVWCHGSNGGGTAAPTNLNFFIEIYTLQLVTNLNADGWIVIQPPQPADNPVGGPGNQETAYEATILADTGLLWTAHTLQWWDHIVSWVQSTYGNWPIVVGGYSIGGWLAAVVAANRESTIAGAMIHHAPTVFSELPSLTSLYGQTTTGVDLGVNYLNGCSTTTPIGICWGTNDNIVGYTTPAAGPLPASNISLIASNATTAGVPITTMSSASYHELTSAEVGTTATAGTWLYWFAQKIDPNCPAVYS